MWKSFFEEPNFIIDTSLMNIKHNKRKSKIIINRFKVSSLNDIPKSEIILLNN